MMHRPAPDEYRAYYAGYIARVPEDRDLWEVLSAQPAELRTLLQHLSDAQASLPPKPGEWSIKEVLGHINDTERVFAFRALWFARGDSTALPGFEQNDFVRGTNFNARNLSELIDEFAYQRQATVLCFKPLTADEINRQGTASGGPFSVRALLFILAGHVLHHMESLKQDYQVGG
jgi:uncharacterized damage-inducible protein DinB